MVLGVTPAQKRSTFPAPHIYIGKSAGNVNIVNNWLGAGDLDELAIHRAGVFVEEGASDVTIVGNTITNQRAEGLIIKGNRVVVNGNRLIGNANASVDPSVYVSGDDVVFTSNYVQSDSDTDSFFAESSAHRLILMQNDFVNDAPVNHASSSHEAYNFP